MLLELRTFLAICDNCGLNREFVASKMKYPPLWATATRLEHVGTRMENEKEALCPNCVVATEHGKKYSRPTLYIFKDE